MATTEKPITVTETASPVPGPSSGTGKSKPKSGSGSSNSVLLTLLPQAPLLLWVAILHCLRLSPPSKYLDLRTELALAVIRSFISPAKPQSVSTTQKLASRAPAPRGHIWVATYACPVPPEAEELKEAIKRGIDGLWDPKIPRAGYDIPEPVAVEAEWTGYRVNAARGEKLPKELGEKGLYEAMMKDVKSPVTVLYFHGGAYCMLDPATHRPTTKTLAKLTGGRVYSVRYRLAPQSAFPAALMDALVSYLALLYPPEGAFHEQVKAENIVFAGDSAGGNLSMVLLQLILYLNRIGHKIQWHGEARDIPLPAGVAVSSPWMDLTHSLPSCTANAAYDYLPTPAQQAVTNARRPPCAIWPTNPPRKHVYTPDALITHPLVSPVLATSWAGAPPVYICAGWELLTDEDRYTAQKLWRDGVETVVFEEYEGMPHCFALIFPYLKEGKRCLEKWAGFIKAVGEQGGNGVGTRFVRVKAKSLQEEVLKPEEVNPFEEEEVRERVWRTVREAGFVGAKL